MPENPWARVISPPSTTRPQGLCEALALESHQRSAVQRPLVVGDETHKPAIAQNQETDVRPVLLHRKTGLQPSDVKIGYPFLVSKVCRLREVCASPPELP